MTLIITTFEEVKRLTEESGLDHEDDDALLIVSALVVGANQKRLAKFTGFEPSWIRERAERLKASGIWVNGKTVCDGDEPGAFEIILFMLVAKGMIEVA